MHLKLDEESIPLLHEALDGFNRAREKAVLFPERNQKVIASNGIATLSGWGKNPPLPDGYIKIEPLRIRSYCQQIGHTLVKHPFDQERMKDGWAGKYHACHAEKQLAFAEPETLCFGVYDLTMCHDCICFFRCHAVFHKTARVVADHKLVRIFKPDYTI